LAVITRKVEPNIIGMNRIILIIVFTISGTFLFAQNNRDSTDIRPINNINLSICGGASIISLNYERLFLINQNFFITGKLGIGYNEEFKLCIFGPCSPPEKYITIPHHITGNLGKGRHFFEFGLGGTIIIGKTNQHYWLYPLVGYRLQPLKSNKVNFRIFGSIPFSGLNSVEDIIFIPFGLSLGVNF
jgi:hypothetical protein